MAKFRALAWSTEGGVEGGGNGGGRGAAAAGPVLSKIHIPRLATIALSLAASCLALQDARAVDRIVLPAEVTPERYDIAIVPDVAHLAFAGTASTTIDVRRPTTSITLNAAYLAFRTVALSGSSGTPQTTLNPAQETATLRFPSPITAGRHVLRIAYTGKINENAAGLFALDYETAHGSRRALFTQFENSDARRFMPCWDEPAKKAVWAANVKLAGECRSSQAPPGNSPARLGVRP